jgi:uncharacterized protein (DUF608 family)
MPRKCKCAGGCVPQVEPEVSRREFIALVGLGAAGALTGDGSAASAAQQEAQLRAWKADLMKPAKPRRYQSGRHRDVRFPLGGIGTGNVELGSDGRFTTWQLFNTLRDGHVPFCLAVRCGDTARLLQTEGGPNWPRVKSIEMTGEYPIADLEFHDEALPVRVSLSAFTPFSPLDAALSSLPVACLVARVHNPTDQEQTVSLGAFLQNAVGYDATGVPVSFNSVGFNAAHERLEPEHPNFGGNYNRASHGTGHTALIMEAVPAPRPTLNRPVTLYTNLDANAFRSPYNDMPEHLTVRSITDLHADQPDPAAGAEIVWLEEPGTAVTGAMLETAGKIAQRGGTLVFSGRTMPLLEAYAQITGGKPLDRVTIQPDILFEDFEHGYENWTVEGKAFGQHPASGTLNGQQPVSGFLGHGLVNSFLGGDGPTGRLISRDFTISRRFVRFLVGGGDSPGTQIRLLVNGKVVRATSGRNEELLLPASWDVHDLMGQTAHIEIVDTETGGWGHINVDEIKFSDYEIDGSVVHALDALLPVNFSAMRPAAHGAVELANATLRSGATSEQNAAAGRNAIVRPHDSGKIALILGGLLAPSEVEILGARKHALRGLCRLAGIGFTDRPGVPPIAPGFGALALATPDKGAAMLPQFTSWDDAWKWFSLPGSKESAVTEAQTPATNNGTTVNGGLAVQTRVPAGKTREIRLFLAWRYPNKYSEANALMGNHYATVWPDIDGVVRHVAAEFNSLHRATEQFRSTFYDSTLPYWLLDAVTSQISTIRHVGVVFRIGNGDVYGWEGSNGCCQPTCTHVWGYEQTLARLFPDLEREMRRIDYRHQQHENGGIGNRTDVPSPPHPTGEFPFADGHASCVLKAYREALNAPDDGFLNDYYPAVKKAVEYLIARDAATSGGEPNGTLEDDQWNTYDEALHGVTTFISGYYLAALRAGEEWARRMGDTSTADRFAGIFKKGQERLIELCWNGEYFEQHLPDYLQRGGEVGPGCMSDQLIGQWWAHQLGLGYILPREHVVSALKSVFRYNWKPDLTGWKHSPRAFAGARDKGLIICTWPKGGRPAGVMLYSDEVWTGIEYQVAAHMIYEGLVEKGLAVIKGLRDRYDGIPRAPIPRNPWNEIECGGHYARAMASWSALLAASGFHYDSPTLSLRMAPAFSSDKFRSFFSSSEGWGTLSQERGHGKQINEIKVVDGSLKLASVRVECAAPVTSAKVRVGDRTVNAATRPTGNALEVRLTAPVALAKGQTMRIEMRHA